MPVTKSAKKRLRQNLARRARNRAGRSALKTQIRKVREACRNGELERAAAEFRLACKKLDQAAAKGLIHRNAAARLKSRLSRALKSAKGAPQAP